MDYIEKVLLSAGGHAAPEEVLDEAALDKSPGDPCWSGYVQVGMKEKNGKRVPNCVPSASTIDYLVASANSNVGVSRHLTSAQADEVSRAALDKYEYLPDEEVYSAILWDLHSYAEYATIGTTDSPEEMQNYLSQMPGGHPAVESSLTASLEWVAGAPELNNSGRDIVLGAFGDNSDYVRSLHASTRLKALISSGNLSEYTTLQLKTLAERYSKVD
jgi:hypothetical protein